MSEIDALMSGMDKIGTSNPIYNYDDEGRVIGVMANASTSMHEANAVVSTPINEVQSQDTFQKPVEFKPTESYAEFFKSVEGVTGDTLTDEEEVAKNNAKRKLLEVIDMMDDGNISYWTKDRKIHEACSKLKPVLTKIRDRI